MRGSVEYPVYKQVVLGLVFLKFINEKFEKRRQELIEMGKEEMLELQFPYAMENVFYIPSEARWPYIVDSAKQPGIKNILDKAMRLIEKENESLKDALPINFYPDVDLKDSIIASLIDLMNEVHLTKDDEEDVIGRVYEYFLAKFSSKEGKGEFYTPKPVVKIIAEMIQPLHGRIFDPCCGSGGMFVQSMKLVNAHHGKSTDVHIYGQEYTKTTYRLAKMNLAIRGISADLGPYNDDSLRHDLHKDLRADFVMANPPFNQKDWGAGEMKNDPRWVYGEPKGNGNYAWIQHFLYHLNDHGVAGFVLANGSLTSTTKGDDEIRRKMVESGVVDCIIMLPDKLFYTVPLSVCLWFCSKEKKYRSGKSKEDILFIDCRAMGRMYDTKHRTIDDEEIEQISNTYHTWKANSEEYDDVVGFCKSVPISVVVEGDCELIPGKYVGFINNDDSKYDVETIKLELKGLFEESNRLEKEILSILERISDD